MVFDSLFQEMSQNLPVYLQVYPPPRNEKVGSQVNLTFWFWMMYHPPPPRSTSDDWLGWSMDSKTMLVFGLLSDLKNQTIVSSCVTHILPSCGYFKGQEQICFNPTSWHLVTYNFLRGHKF